MKVSTHFVFDDPIPFIVSDFKVRVYLGVLLDAPRHTFENELVDFVVPDFAFGGISIVTSTASIPPSGLKKWLRFRMFDDSIAVKIGLYKLKWFHGLLST